MKTGIVICGPDVPYGPLALLTGTFEEKIAKAAGLGFDGVELMVRDPTQLDHGAIQETLSAAGLDVPQIVTGELFGADGLCLVTADDDLYRRALARTCAVIDMAAPLGAIVNIGRLRGRLAFLGDVSDPWGIALERLRAVAVYGAERGVRIALEPLNRYETDFLFSSADGVHFLEELGCDNVGLMLDLFHMNIEDASIEDGLRLAGDRLWHVHVADSNRCYPGAGHLDFDSIFATLTTIGYQDYVSAEMLPVPDPDAAARRTIEFLRGLVV